MIENLQREGLPTTIDVHVLDDGELRPASPDLADDVREDLAATRTRILQEFGHKTIPNIGADLLQRANNYFHDRQWSLPKSVVIDPMQDALALRSIMRSATFRSRNSEEFFTGANGEIISPGGSPIWDLVIFHDTHSSRARYRTEILNVLDGWRCAMRDEFLEEAVNLKVGDLVVHEFSHLAGNLAVKAVVLEKTDGKYDLTSRDTAGFITIHNSEEPTLEESTGWYVGPAINEAWAALNSSRFLLRAQDQDCTAIPIQDRYWIKGDIIDEDGQEYLHPVTGLHSMDAGIVIEGLDTKYPGVISTMTDVADGKIGVDSALGEIQRKVPFDIFTLLNSPQYSAWQELREKLGI